MQPAAYLFGQCELDSDTHVVLEVRDVWLQSGWTSYALEVDEQLLVSVVGKQTVTEKRADETL